MLQAWDMGLTLEPSGDTANKMLHSKRLKILAAHLFGCKNKCVFVFRSTNKKRALFKQIILFASKIKEGSSNCV